jgi:hypothetical protein
MAFDDLECVKIGASRDDLKRRTEAYLRAKGWEHTSSTIDSCWRWFKTVDGRSYGCGTDDAFRIQDCLDRREYERAHPDEFND